MIPLAWQTSGKRGIRSAEIEGYLRTKVSRCDLNHLLHTYLPFLHGTISFYCDSTDMFICIDRKDGSYDSLKMCTLYALWSISFMTVQIHWCLLIDLLLEAVYKEFLGTHCIISFNMSAPGSWPETGCFPQKTVLEKDFSALGELFIDHGFLTLYTQCLIPPFSIYPLSYDSLVSLTFF